MTDFRTYRMKRSETIVFAVIYLILAAVLALLLYRSAVFGIILIPFAPRIRGFYLRYRMERRKEQYLVEFKDFLFLAATSIGAGRSMKDAIREAIPGLQEIYGERSILCRELLLVYERMEVGNEDDVDVLMDLAVLSGQPDVIDFVTIYRACRRTGASLILAMNRAASMIIDKMSIEREIRELTRRKETEGLMIFLMPPVVLIFLNLSAPDYVAPLYQTLTGRLIMTAVVAANIGIYEMIRKIVKVEI